MTPRIGVVGLGRMGANMARRLHDLGFAVAALYDVNTAVAEELANELGMLAASNLAAVTANSDIIITVVSDDAAMRQIFGDAPDHLLTNAQGKLFINCATLTPGVHQAVAAWAEAAGAHALEAAMASSIDQARTGTLYLMCGGRPEVFERAKPVLAALSSNLRLIGPIGTAAQVKALVNMVMNINTAGLAEGLGLGAALGLDVGMLREVFSQTGANSRVLETDGGDMQARDHACYFSAAHAAKDSGIAVTLGQQAGVSLPLAEATLKQYQRMEALGLGELDKSGIAELTFPGRLA